MKLNKAIGMIMITGAFYFTACKRFIEIDPPKNSLVPSTVFKSNELASSAIQGIYQGMSQNGFASGDRGSLSIICGLTADEFLGYDVNLQSAFDNTLTPNNSPTNSLWTQMYKSVYDSNAILEGLSKADGISSNVKEQLRGEAYFIRAFNFFYLVNLFGAIPLPLTTDYKINAEKTKMPVEDVYAQIIEDLKLAESLLSEDYVTGERVRPNKYVARALLARTYLNMRDWANSEMYSSLIIDKTDKYQLVPLSDVFLSNSKETIWQLVPPAGGNTFAGRDLLPVDDTTVPTLVSLRPEFIEHSFEDNDIRRQSWVKSAVVNGVTYYYPFKYKIQNSPIVSEYFTVFRLAEQFLIRAEARTRQNKLSAAIDDLDSVRGRAGLTKLKVTSPGIDQPTLIDTIQNERRIELFSEWGDRWINLKRLERSTFFLSSLKANWKPEFILYPIPLNEVSRNKNIIQNSGY